ncbi:Lrp/AsnC family transcriptional regulator [Candidatus Woesearchaeota archaeon]|nr:Lrp/AsnC family transcriptional regulator [Candidatus Woesearchaeota archaeon]MBT3537120.1 Lrp/AsnC family transcriptional regulator [Candidatus Woesearchaeota archaeon]MBT4696963.1 Lrp/AsnC family transcriptional regulator [Candidatus Woesearchaeota archaeon]MBT4716469.1 Lrp/AsnC family transcriptional regulator [Candidatus Woesearchaeota archaeon]MBT7106570.1 Lrp/AsnC family transcriptional regulator [Candidatus Woesearchaeota archaeon]
MNTKVFQLLSHLRENSREKLTTISKATNIPISTLFDFLKDLQGGVITKSTVLLNFSELGYHTHAHVFLKVGVDSRDKLKKHLYFHDNVNSVFKLNDGWNFVVETAHKSVKELDAFIEDLGAKFSLEDHKIHYLVDEIKKEGFKF